MRHPEEAAQRLSRRTQGADATPWPALLRAALAMGITPEAFWRLSLAEWRAISGGGGEVLGRGGFDELMRRYPDD